MSTVTTVGQFALWLVGAGTLGGLASGEINRWRSARETRKQNVRRLLSHLLELRGTLIAMGQLRRALTELFPDQAGQIAVFAPRLMTMFSNGPQLQQRYETAVNELAALDPLLAHRLQSKHLVGTAITLLAQLPVQNDPAALALLPPVMEMLGDVGKSTLDTAIIRVAEHLGSDVVRDTNEVLREQLDIPEEAKKYLQTLRTIASQAGLLPPDKPTGGAS